MKYRIEKRAEAFVLLKEGAEIATGTKAEVLHALAGAVNEGMVLAPIIEEATGKPGSKWAVCVIEGGLSKNRTLYSPAVLRAAAPMYEGAKVFFNHTDEQKGGMRDPRDIAGFLRGPRFEESGRGSVLAVLHATSPVLREQLLEAHEAENPDLVGLSHTAVADAVRVSHPQHGVIVQVNAIKAVESVDVVSFPSAGGRVLRLVAGLPSPVEVTTQELEAMKEKIARLKEARPDLFAKLKEGFTEADVDTLLLEALGTKAPETKAPEPKKPEPVELTEAEKREREQVRKLIVRGTVSAVMEGRQFGVLEDVAKEQITALAEAGQDEVAIAKAADGWVAKAAKLAEANPGATFGRTVEATKDEADKLMDALDGMFMSRASEAAVAADKARAFGGRRETKGGFGSIREAYIAVTGDTRVTGRVEEAKGLRRFARLTEGMDSTTFSKVLGDSITRRMTADYSAVGGAYSDWGRGWLCTVVPAGDFRSQKRDRIGGYGNFSIVSEGTPYPTVASPTDEEASYSVAKRGGVESVTFEMIKNDDMGAILRIPRSLSYAARRTLYEYVYSLIITNPAIYDGVTLFHANHGGNLGSSALASNTYMAARLVMLKQTEKDSGKRLGLAPKHLMVPPDLEETAKDLFVRNTNNDPKFIQSEAPTIHVITHTTDANDWFVAAGVDQCEQVELAFLDGQEEPSLFVADMPNAGSLFTADKIDYKLRHIYGGAVLDFRGLYGAIV